MCSLRFSRGAVFQVIRNQFWHRSLCNCTRRQGCLLHAVAPEGVHQAFEASPAPETTWKGQAENGKGGSHEHDHHNVRAERAHGSRTRRIAPIAHPAAGRVRSRIAGTPQYPGIAGEYQACAGPSVPIEATFSLASLARPWLIVTVFHETKEF